MLNVTPRAATLLEAARTDAGAPKDYGVRFFAQAKEGQEPRLAIGFAAEPGPSDTVNEHGDLKTFVAPEVTEALTDVTLDARASDGQEELVLVHAEAPTS
jgi:Fe-S cluster assembly iron-binding protein IscA